MQIWLPDDGHTKLACQTAYGCENDDLAESFESQTFAKGEGLIGQVWLTGVPVIGVSSFSGKLSDPVAISSSLLAMPVIDQGENLMRGV